VAVGSGDGDLRFDKASVAKITTGLRAAIGELGEVGDSTGSVMGKGFSHLALTGMEAGHHGVSEDFGDFCDRWDWGVRALIQDASEIAARLGLAAGTQWEEDQYLGGSLKVLANSALGGNPNASEEDIEKQGWKDVLTPDAPDYSGKSFEDAADQAGQTWKDTGRSLLTDGQGGAVTWAADHAAGISDSERDKALDQVFGPSPEERAARQGDGGK
jgi:hypothetical protein